MLGKMFTKKDKQITDTAPDDELKREIRSVYDSFDLDIRTRTEVLNKVLNAASDQSEKASEKNSWSKYAAMAAAFLAGILIMGSIAYAAGWINAKDVQMETQYVDYDKNSIKHEPDVHYVSLVGKTGTPEYEACQEWEAFYWPYIHDHRQKITNNTSSADSYYKLYGCWTQEMKEKLDEILIRYDLSPHQTLTGVNRLDDLCEAVGIKRILPDLKERTDDDQDYWYYNDGSFYIERPVDWDYRESDLSFRLNRYVYGTLNTVSINIDLSKTTTWHYMTKRGVEVTAFEITEPYYIESNENVHAPFVLFMIERPESFVTIHIIYESLYAEDGYTFIGYDVPTREQLQEFLESVCLENIP